MSINVELLLTCVATSIDLRRNDVSAFQIIEQVQAVNFPLVIPQVAVLGILTREESDPAVVECSLVWRLNGNQTADFPLNTDFQGLKRARILADVQGVVVQAPGLLEIVLRFGGEDRARWFIEVSKVGGVQEATKATSEAVNVVSEGRSGKPPNRKRPAPKRPTPKRAAPKRSARS